MSSLNTVAGQWATFETVLPLNAPPMQRKEMRLAFYAGVEAVLRILVQIGRDDVSQEAGEALLQSLHDECQAFARAYGQTSGLPEELMDLIAPKERQKGRA